MQRTVLSFLVLGVYLASVKAVAQETTDAPPPGEGPDAQTAEEAQAAEAQTAQPTPATASAEVKPPPEPTTGWHTEVSGYFRAPVTMGLSSRFGPERDPTTNQPIAPASTQVSYGPNRTVDSSYYSFAYTRLQEQDWAEIFVHAKKEHVDAAVGWMGYWFQSAAFRNPDAAWAPGMAYLTLDSDLGAAVRKPNLALTVGAWWPRFGYFEKYDTYTLGRFRQIGGQLKAVIPIDRDLTFVGHWGFGTNRDGSFNFLAPPFYGAITGLDLISWVNLQIAHRRLFDAAFHFNTEITRDPNLTQQLMAGDKSYEAAKLAHLSVIGLEGNLRLGPLGHVWISPSYIHVRNGWALASAGTEVMHALGGLGIATNYLAWTGSPTDSTGSGSMINLGFLYENSRSAIQGTAPGSVLPEVIFSAFALFTDASLNLPAGTTLTQNTIKQLKYGADVTLQPLTWLGLMLRYDLVNYDLDHSGIIFQGVSLRTIVSSHYLSSERIYLQYTRYRYGDKMVLNGTWPWGAPLVAGANVLQQGPYSGQKGDENVVKLQAEIAF